MGYLLDTNVLIKYLNASFPPNCLQYLNSIVDDEPIVSIITKIETLGFNFKSAEEQSTVEIFMNGSSVLDLNKKL